MEIIVVVLQQWRLFSSLKATVFIVFTVNKQKRHQWQIVEPQQKHKHKIQLVTFQYLCMYLILIKLTWGHTLSRLAIWSIILSWFGPI